MIFIKPFTVSDEDVTFISHWYKLACKTDYNSLNSYNCLPNRQPILEETLQRHSVDLPQHFDRIHFIQFLLSTSVSSDSQVEAHCHFPPLLSSKVTFYPQRYAGGDGNDRYEWQRPL